MASRIQTTNGELSESLRQTGGRIVKVINDAMGVAMKDVLKRARDYVPVEEHKVEAAIKLGNENRRRTWYVYVDTAMPDDTGNYTVGDYAMWLHEDQTYNLGKDSLAKDAGRRVVGPKYLDRAFNEVINDDFVDKLREMAKQYGVF